MFVFTHQAKKVSKEEWEQAQPKVKFPSAGDQRLEEMNVIVHTTRPNGTPAVVKPAVKGVENEKTGKRENETGAGK